MASLLRFATSRTELQNEIKARHDSAESSRRLHFIAARKIQAWFRGIATRNHLRMLHECATVVQRHWRGYHNRMFVNRYLVERVHQMWQDHYNSMATRIQAIWRGYWTRKTQVNVLQLRQWRKDVHAKNGETLENMKKFRQQELDYAENVTEQEAMHWILFILFKLHHLLSTKFRPGVIAKIDKARFTYIEQMLKCLEYDRYVVRPKTVCGHCRLDHKRSQILRGTYFEKCENEIRDFERSLRTAHALIFRDENLFEANDENAGKISRLGRRGCEQSDTSPQSLMQADKLFKVVSKMDCQLHRFHLNCPIHNVIF